MLITYCTAYLVWQKHYINIVNVTVMFNMNFTVTEYYEGLFLFASQMAQQERFAS